MPRPTVHQLRETCPDPVSLARMAHDLERDAAAEARQYGTVRAEAIAELIEGLGWSLADVARELGVSKAMIQKIVERHRERALEGEATISMTMRGELTVHPRGESK